MKMLISDNYGLSGCWLLSILPTGTSPICEKWRRTQNTSPLITVKTFCVNVFSTFTIIFNDL